MIKKFLTSVADVYGYDNNDNLLFTGKTLLDSSIEVTLGSTPVRGGRGNQLHYTYYHTGEMNFTLTDTQWNLQMLGATVGSDVVTGNNVYVEEDVVLSGTGAGSVTQTPLAFEGTTIYGWATESDGTVHRVTMLSDKSFTGAGTVASGETVCVRYYTLDSASTSITIEANMIPKVVKLVMESQLNSSDVTTNKIGIAQIIAPKVTLSGAFTISMTSDGVSNTPLTGMALATTDSSSTSVCGNEPYYARIIEIIDDANWYDNVIGLSIEGGDFALATTTGTQTLSVWAVPSNGAPFKPPVADLDFTSGTTGVATVGLNTGLVTGVSDGTAVITVKGGSGLPAAIQAIEASCTVTVPA